MNSVRSHSVSVTDDASQFPFRNRSLSSVDNCSSRCRYVGSDAFSAALSSSVAPMNVADVVTHSLTPDVSLIWYCGSSCHSNSSSMERKWRMTPDRSLIGRPVSGEIHQYRNLKSQLSLSGLHDILSVGRIPDFDRQRPQRYWTYLYGN